jgi:hypothetical protein
LIGLFSGESQTKALNRTLDQLNAQGFAVASMVVDRWSFWRRLGWLLILILTLGFVGKVPNVLIATEPIRAASAASSSGARYSACDAARCQVAGRERANAP